MQVVPISRRGILALAMAAMASAAFADPYPTKTVRIVLAYAPGGAPDVLARTLAVSVSEQLGQQVIIDNRPGAGGISAADHVARSAGDGHTLLVTEPQTLAINPHIFKKLPYDATRDFAPVTLAVTFPLYIAVQSSLNIKSIEDLSRYAKAHPGELTYASSGIGSVHHIAMEALLHALDIAVTHIPYRGTGQSVPAFFAGDTSIVISALPPLIGFMDAAKFNIIGITTAKRSPITPDIPAIAESIAGFDYSSEMGFSVPAGTPAAIIDRLSSAFAVALQQPAALQNVEKMGGVVVSSTPDDYKRNIAENYAKFGKTISQSNIKPE